MSSHNLMSVPGYSRATEFLPRDACQRGASFSGAWDDVPTLSACAKRCLECDFCNFISFSRDDGQGQSDCSWHFSCKMDKLLIGGVGRKFRTRQLRNVTLPSLPRFSASLPESIHVTVPNVSDSSSIVIRRLFREAARRDSISMPKSARNVLQFLRGETVSEYLQLPRRSATNSIALRHLAHRLALGTQKVLRIVIYGTSITDGLYPQLLEIRLQQRFPQVNVSVAAHAYPGASPSFMFHCADSMVPDLEADLFILEQWSGDRLTRTPPWGKTDVDDDLLGIVRKLQRRRVSGDGSRRQCRLPAVMLLSTLDQLSCVRRLKRMAPFEQEPRDPQSMRAAVETCLYGEQLKVT